MATEATKTVFSPGDVIADRYRVERPLGQGGMGMVYLVSDVVTGQRLALKTLLPKYTSNKRAVHRFVREVNAVRQLNHPAIVKIHDARQIGSRLFYTMEYIHGKSLRRWLQQRGRLGFGSTVRILALLAHALEHAHKFTIHRDISPDNVMVLPDGSVRLLDFGLAKLTGSQSAFSQAVFTQIGVSLGKVQYIAPEQCASAAEVDHRADIYSLGVMFYEMLSGKLPRPGDHLTELVPRLPKECEAFVRRAMAPSPEDRFASAGEFRAALLSIYGRSVRKDEAVAQEPEKEAGPGRRFPVGLGDLWAKLRGVAGRFGQGAARLFKRR